MNYLKTTATLIPLFLLLSSVAGVFIWKVAAQPAVKLEIDSTIKPFKLEIDRLKIRADKQDSSLKEVKFSSKQQLFLLKRIAGKRVVKEMEEETADFNPWN